MERNLIQYLPQIVRDYDAFKGITEGEQPVFEAVWDAADKVLDNQFVMVSQNLGLSRWERILKITPKGTDSLEERRFRVLTRLNEELPYTLPQLRIILETLCGEGNYSAEIQEGTYIFVIRVALTAKSNFQDVESLFERIVPENLVIDLSLLYNTHEILGKYTHAELSVYTCKQVREDVLGQ